MVFFFTQPIVICTDPESVKVCQQMKYCYYIIRWSCNFSCTTDALIIQAIAMQPKLDKDPRYTSNLAAVFGERFGGPIRLHELIVVRLAELHQCKMFLIATTG